MSKKFENFSEFFAKNLSKFAFFNCVFNGFQLVAQIKISGRIGPSQFEEIK